ncbi:MAG: hypothetical protein R3E68_22310 [Burkholderiaceae bacterium]
MGSHIHFDGRRMKVTEPPEPEFWAWLTLAGWRECRFSGDRRRYVNLPENAFKRLASRQSASREEYYHQLMDRSSP